MFKVDVRKLSEQYMDVILYAARLYENGRKVGTVSTSVKAWTGALQKCLDRRMRHNHPVTELAKNLYNYIAWAGCSTSSVERGLGKLAKLLGNQRKDLDIRSQEGELKLQTDMGDMTHSKLINAAIQIFRDEFPPARSWAKTGTRFISKKQKDSPA